MIDIQRGIISKLIRDPREYTLVAEMLKPEMFSDELIPVFTVLQDWCLSKSEIDVTLLARECGTESKMIRGIFFEDAVGDILSYAEKLRSNYLQNFTRELYLEALDDLNAGTPADQVNDRTTSQVAMEVMSVTSTSSDTLEAAIQESRDLFERARNSTGPSGIDTGFSDLNRLNGGWQKTDQMVLAGRPGMGKTHMACNMLLNVAEQGLPVAFVSLEMPEVQIVQRLASIISGVSTEKIRTGDVVPYEADLVIEAHDRLEDMPITIYDNLYEVNEICRKIIALNRKIDLSLVCYDYIQRMRTKGSFGSRADEIEYASGRLKQVAKSENITNLVLAQINRNVENRGGSKRPSMSDLKASGAIEEDADMVGLLYRPAYYGLLEPGQEDSTELIISKNRHGGRCGTLNRKFISERFFEENYTTSMPVANDEEEILF